MPYLLKQVSYCCPRKPQIWRERQTRGWPKPKSKRIRKRTTKHAADVIESNLEAGILGAAVVVASNYVQLRLGTPLADYFAGRKKEDWSDLAELFRSGQARDIIEKSSQLGLLEGEEHGKLNELFNLRNKAAHHTDLWKGEEDVEPGLARQARSVCRAAKSFLKRTTRPDF